MLSIIVSHNARKSTLALKQKTKIDTLILKNHRFFAKNVKFSLPHERNRAQRDFYRRGSQLADS